MNTQDLRLVTKVARLYYMEGLNQEEIARRCRTSRSTISRLLRQAREAGLVTITINEPPGNFSDLERALEREFGLQEAVVVSQDESDGDLQASLGRSAARYIERVVRPGDVLGVSWGTSLRATINSVSGASLGPVTVVPLVGGVGQTDPEIHSNQLAIDLARALGGNWHLLHAPAIVSSSALREAILADPKLGEVLEVARSANMALVGIGAPIESSTMIHTGYFGAGEIEELKAHRAVGDVCSQFYDLEGRRCDLQLNDRIIGITLEDLKRIPLVVAVAGGASKVGSVLGALRGGFLDVLITDHGTAQSVIELGGGAGVEERDTASGPGLGASGVFKHSAD